MPNLFIDIEARFAQFQDSLDQVSKNVAQRTANMSKAFSGVGAAFGALGVGLSVAGLAAFGKSALDSIAALDDLAEKTSLTVETLSQLQAVTRVGGHSLDDVARSASRFARSVSEAAGGNKELLGFFKQLGISAQELKTLKFDELFVKYGTAVANAKDQTNAIAVAQKLAGKSAAELMPFWKDLAERGLDVAKVTTEMAASAEKVQKNFKELARSSAEARDNIVGNLLPGLIRVSEVAKKAAEEGNNLLVVMLKVADATFFGDEQLKQDRLFVDNVNRKLQLERRIAEQEQVSEEKRRNIDRVRLQRDKDELTRTDARIAGLQREREAREKANAPRAQEEGRVVGAVANPEAAAEAERKRLKALAEHVKAQEFLGKQLAENQENEIQQAAQISQLTDDHNAKLRERTALEEKWNQEFLGMTIEEIRAWEQLQFQIIDTGRAMEEAQMRLAAGFDEEGNVIDKLKETNDVARELGLTFQSAFEDAILEGEKFRDVLQGMLKDIGRIILRKGVTEPLADAVMSSDIVKGIGGAFKGMFGGARAGGGSVSAGQMHLVGERGPELFVPNTSGNIVPNDQLGGSFNVNVNFGSGPPTDPQAVVSALIPIMKTIARGEIGQNLLPGGVFNPT